MGDEAVGGVRERVREGVRAERVKKRESLYHKQRKLDAKLIRSKLNEELKEEEVISAARALSAHSANKESAFTDLKNAFIQNPTHMITFLKVEGALNALIGHLMGADSYYELLAIECCCNLSLGDSKTCYKLAKAATPYLLTILQGLDNNLMNVALLTVNNLLGSGAKSCELLHSQGILKALQRTLSLPELRENSAKALIMFAMNGASLLSSEEMKHLTSFVLPYFESSDRIQWLVYMLSSLPGMTAVLIECKVHVRVLRLLSALRRPRPDNIISVTSLVRLLGNLSSDPEGRTVGHMLEQWESTLAVMKSLSTSQYRHLAKEIYWSLGNMIQHRSPEVQRALKEKTSGDFSWLERGFGPSPPPPPPSST